MQGLCIYMLFRTCMKRKMVRCHVCPSTSPFACRPFPLPECFKTYYEIWKQYDSMCCNHSVALAYKFLRSAALHENVKQYEICKCKFTVSQVVKAL
jgi:hypothetical protein